MTAKAEKTLVVVCGPTAVGKTDFAIRLAKCFNSEIISADSRQLYREIPIGTAQPSLEELAQIRHHFIGCRSITEDYNAGMYERDALKLLDELFVSHNTIICCGGTGLYIKALTEGVGRCAESGCEFASRIKWKIRIGGSRISPKRVETIGSSSF